MSVSASPVPAEAGSGPVLFVGLGAMGMPMSGLLGAAGHEVWLCDARTEHAQRLAAQRGARCVALAGLAGDAYQATTVMLMLPDSDAVEAVLVGGPDGGLLAQLPRGALLIDMGSSQPSATVRLAERAAELGVEFVDAPVSGGVARAVTGELSIMVGGSARGVRRAGPLLSRLGTQVTHVGPVGAGHAMKALNNLLSAIGMAAAAEVLAIGAKFGLEPQIMLDVLNASTGGNHATRVKMAQFVLSRKFDSGFSLQLMAKDLRTALQLAHETGTPVPVAASCLKEWNAASQLLGAGADHTHIAAYVEARAGIELGGPQRPPPEHTVCDPTCPPDPTTKGTR